MLAQKTGDSSFEWIERGGPILAAAVHDGHSIRSELRPYLEIDEETQLREEDPMTGIWACIGDDVFRTTTSRFEVDLNRSRERAVSTKPEDTWGIQVWRELPPEEMIERSLVAHDCFYRLMSDWCERRVRDFGRALVFDIHSYNHCRSGPGNPASEQGNPDIDLGLTTVNRERFGSVAGAITQYLSRCCVMNRPLDVRANVRYPDGGNFPEWLFANFGDDVCVVTLEVKKIYMDEWSGAVNLPIVYQLLEAMQGMKSCAQAELLKCR